MTIEEKKIFSDLTEMIQKMNEENIQFRKSQEAKMVEFEKRMTSSLQPLNFEKEILRSAQEASFEAIKGVLSRYDGPMAKLVLSVVNENSTELRVIISDAFTQVMRSEDFKLSMLSACSHKVARSIISNSEGLFDKVTNELKQDATFKARVTIAVGNVVNECLAERRV